MKRYLASLLAILALAVSANAAKVLPTEVKGTVKDTAGNPIAGVVVTDGYTVVTTNAAGEYCFPRVPEAYYVSISVPSEYEVTLRQGHPVFYEKLIDDKSYDFILKPLKGGPENDFNLFLIGDPQCQRVSHVRRMAEEGIADVKAYSKKFKGPKYAMTLGDLGYSEGFRNTNYLFSMIYEEMSAEKVGMPVFQTVGNHDFEYAPGVVDAANPTVQIRRDRMYESVFGPANYSFNRGQVHIISMNNVSFESITNPAKYHGDFTDEQVKWLAEDLKYVPEDNLVILCIHIPMEGLYKHYENAQKVMDILGARKHAQIISGHTHTVKHLHYKNGVSEYVAGAMSGCWWWSKNCADGTPNGYTVYRISGNQVVSDIYKGQNFSDSYQMRIYRGGSEFGGPYEKFKLAQDSNVLLVNVWNWDEGWRSEVYENGKLSGELELMPLTSELQAPYDGSKDWWAIGYNVGVVGRGHINGSTRNNYCSKNYHMLKYVMKDPDAKIKVVVYDKTGRKFTETHITTADDYATMAAPPAYPVDPAWEQ